MPTILPITDFLDPQLDIYARLSENQLLNRCDPQNGIFIAESPKAARISRFFPPHLRCSHS